MCPERETGRRHRQGLSVLLLCDNHRSHAGTVLEHIDALSRFSRHDVKVYNPRGVKRSHALALDDFDVVVVHYSLMILSDHHLSPDFREKIARFNGLKIQYIQDDYRQVDQIASCMRQLGIDVLFTLVPEREIAAVWTPRLPGVRVSNTLAGYVPQAAEGLGVLPAASRSVDVGYRGRELPYWIGKLGQEKVRIARGFAERAEGTGLAVDIGWLESDRIYGQGWLDFIASCRATLGTESGASITDFDGSLQLRVEAYIAGHPEADFDEVSKALLAPYEGNVAMNVISPRIFEAIALRTALILFPGEYSEVIEPERHYIVLQKDFSNFDEVVAQVRDHRTLDALTTRTHREIVGSGRYSYRQMVTEFDTVADELGVARRHPPRLRYALSRAEHPFGERLPPGVRRHAFVIGSPLEDARAAMVFAASTALAARDAQIRRFARTLLMTRAVPPARWWTIMRDLVRLAVVRRGHTGRLTAGPPFAVQAELTDDSHELLLRSVPLERWKPTDLQPSDVNRRLADGSLHSVVWDHSAVDTSFLLPFTAWRRVQLRVSAKNTADSHEFRGILAAGRRVSEETTELLAPLIGPPAAQKAPPAEVRPLPLVLLILRHPRHYTFIVERRALRRLLLAMLKDPRMRNPQAARAGARELTRLALLADGRSGHLEGIAGVAAARVGGTLHFTTVAEAIPGEPSSLDLSDVDRLVWDNSIAGVHVERARGKRRAKVALGAGGVQEFPLVSRLLGTHREVVRDALAGR